MTLAGVTDFFYTRDPATLQLMSSDQKPKLVVIVGPTGSGKTGLAIKLAKRFRGEVISADSRQVYRGLDIGTEKVTREEMSEVPHHLIDIADVETVYNATDFSRDAAETITSITKRGHVPIIAGGTFFYIDVLLGRISTPAVPPDPELRTHLESLSTDELSEQLLTKDPSRASTIDTKNRRRLVRALEIINSLGSVPEQLPAEPPYNVLTIGLEIDRVEHKIRLRERAVRALERGLIAETETLLAKGVTKERLNEIGLEYRLVTQLLDGLLTTVELVDKLAEKNWQYAKRQLVWLKRDAGISWHRHSEFAAIESEVADFLKS